MDYRERKNIDSASAWLRLFDFFPNKNQVTDNYYMPDLTKAALARLSAVHRSMKVAKSDIKKRNMQELKVHGRK
ncbi:hypothetical protein GQ457_08G037490 [Hibiscus cannabinus]